MNNEATLVVINTFYIMGILLAIAFTLQIIATKLVYKKDSAKKNSSEPQQSHSVNK